MQRKVRKGNFQKNSLKQRLFRTEWHFYPTVRIKLKEHGSQRTQANTGCEAKQQRPGNPFLQSVGASQPPPRDPKTLASLTFVPESHFQESVSYNKWSKHIKRCPPGLIYESKK